MPSRLLDYWHCSHFVNNQLHYIGHHPKLIVKMYYDFNHFKIIKLLAFPDNNILMKFHFKKRKWSSDSKCINSSYISTLRT